MINQQKRKPFIGGNWKMKGDLAFSLSLAEQLQLDFQPLADLSSFDCVVFPSFIHLLPVINELTESLIHVGAQNVCHFEQGAYTGEIAASMLKAIKCHYVLIGHSERRRLFGDDALSIATKIKLAIEYGILPIVCIGQTEQFISHNHEIKAVINQLKDVIGHIGLDWLEKAVLAYEPTWAIGTGKTPDPVAVQDLHYAIRQYLAVQNASSQISKTIRIIYGGSLTADNAHKFCCQPDIDGGLIGGASLKAKSFVTIVKTFATG